MLAASDVVLTTYNTLAADYAKKSSPLHEIFWYRVVLDEGNSPSLDLLIAAAA